MAMDEREQVKEESDLEQSQQTQTAAGQEEENPSRLDAAKAFFRALHAGHDAPADAPTNGSSGEPAGRSSGPCMSCQRMEAQVGEAEQRAVEAESLYKRMAADFDNYRRRIEREREEFQAIGTQKAVEVLLPALDDMDRAQTSLKPDTPTEKLIESLNLVFNRVTRCLEQMGVKTLSVVGEHFDPKYHEPVQEVETTEFPDGAVMQELRRGYTINDRVIRPALVNVAANSSGTVQSPPDGGDEQSEPVQSEAAETQESKVYDLSEFDESEQSSSRTADAP
jgi:molecular chaperone GrpE